MKNYARFVIVYTYDHWDHLLQYILESSLNDIINQELCRF